MNAITITGNIANDPEIRQYTDREGKQRSLLNFVVANNELVGGNEIFNGYVDITAFNLLGANAAKSLRKGERVVVTGRIQQSTFEREDGTRGARVRLVANAIGLSLEFTPAKRADAPADASAQEAPDAEVANPL